MLTPTFIGVSIFYLVWNCFVTTTPSTKVYVTTNVIKGVSGSGGSPQFVKCFTNSNSAVRYYRKVLLLSVELRIVDFAVESAKLHKGVMVTGLYDIAVLHNKYQVGVLDCRKPVRDNKACSAARQ